MLEYSYFYILCRHRYGLQILPPEYQSAPSTLSWVQLSQAALSAGGWGDCVSQAWQAGQSWEGSPVILHSYLHTFPTSRVSEMVWVWVRESEEWQKELSRVLMSNIANKQYWMHVNDCSFDRVSLAASSGLRLITAEHCWAGLAGRLSAHICCSSQNPEMTVSSVFSVMKSSFCNRWWEWSVSDI